MRRRLGRGGLQELARSLNDLGVVRSELGDAEAAVAMHREALEVRQEVLGDTDRATGVPASNLTAALYGTGDHEGGARQAELALELLRRSVGPDHQRHHRPDESRRLQDRRRRPGGCRRGVPGPARETVQAPPARIQWAVLLARIYDVLPLLRPACGGQMRILAFLTDPPVVSAILPHLVPGPPRNARCVG